MPFEGPGFQVPDLLGLDLRESGSREGSSPPAPPPNHAGYRQASWKVGDSDTLGRERWHQGEPCSPEEWRHSLEPAQH